MKIPILLSLATTLSCLSTVDSFQQRSLTRVTFLSRKGTTSLLANERDDFIPETSFGAEVVPEGQRPVNEYLEMRRSPLFEWASNEVGTKGVSLNGEQ